jgi:hypothetical protein
MNSKQIQQQLNLAAEADAELLALLEGIEDRPARLHPESAALLEPITPREVRLKVGEAVAMHSVAELLSSARKDNSLTLERWGSAKGASHNSNGAVRTSNRRRSHGSRKCSGTTPASFSDHGTRNAERSRRC